jgi:hypothetical protein
MPLSEQEQRLLEEMERSLYHNDADFVAGSTGRHGRPTYATIVTGVLVGIVGVATLIAGVGVRLPVIGVVGFILMFAGVLIALTPSRGASGKATAGSSRTGSARDGASAADSSGGNLRQNGTDQWDDRAGDHDE